MENADMTIILNLERRQKDKKLFLTFYRIKERYRPFTNMNYFNQPFVEGNDFMLVDDITDKEAQGVISLATDLIGVDADMMFDNGNHGRKNHKQPSMSKDNKTNDLFAIKPLSN